jgi:predicted transcriptional regulator
MHNQQDIATMSVDLVRTMIAAGKVANAADIPDLIEKIGANLRALADIGGPRAVPEARALVFKTAAELGQAPAVPIRESIVDNGDFIVCLEDGRKMKMLKRHLRTAYGMTPEDYRRKWGLPVDYPMIAPNAAKQKSKYARRVGLGTHRMRDEVARRREGAAVAA